MNQSLEAAKIAFVKRVNACFDPRTSGDPELFLLELFEQLGVRTPKELNQVATLIIQNHKPKGWPSIAYVLEYANKVKAKQSKVTVIEKNTPEWNKERQRRVDDGLGVALMDRSKTWTVGPTKSPARRNAG